MNETSVILHTDSGRRGTMADFVDHFRRLWEEPQRHLDTFLDCMSPDIRLTAPLVGSSQGREAGYRAFRDAFAALPDLHGRVKGWSGVGDRLFIEMDFIATVAGRPMVWHNVDSFRFADGMAVERRAYFDPLPLLVSFARRPSGWKQLWRLASKARARAKAG